VAEKDAGSSVLKKPGINNYTAKLPLTAEGKLKEILNAHNKTPPTTEI
jgi:hypothetical protein